MGSPARLCVSAVIQHQGTGPPVAIRDQAMGALLWKGCLTGAQTWAPHCTGIPRGTARPLPMGHRLASRVASRHAQLPWEGRGERAHLNGVAQEAGGHDPASQPTGQLSFTPDSSFLHSLLKSRLELQARGMRGSGPPAGASRLLSSHSHWEPPGSRQSPRVPLPGPPVPLTLLAPGPSRDTLGCPPRRPGLSPRCPERALPSALLCCGRLENVPGS